MNIESSDPQLHPQILALPKGEFEHAIVGMSATTKRAWKLQRRKLLNRRSAKKSAQEKSKKTADTSAQLYICQEQNKFLSKMVDALSSHTTNMTRIKDHYTASLRISQAVNMTLHRARKRYI